MIRLAEWTEERRHLLFQAMESMDQDYDSDAGLLRDYEDPDLHGSRRSAHYALGLLMRNGPGDVRRAGVVLEKVMDLHLDGPDEIYDGTFRTSPQAPNPPAGNYPWKTFAPGFAHFLEETLQKISAQFIHKLHSEHPRLAEFADRKALEGCFQAAADSVLPAVWRSFDPNWREFIACTFAAILEHFEGRLPSGLVARMDRLMKSTVSASIDRRMSDAIPMNSNIELMHLFISHYFGFRYGDAEWIAHADRESARFHASYMEFGSLAEFNSATYYGVDLAVLGLWRTCGKSAAFVQIGRDLEKGLWENIAIFYNPNLENLSGPYSRAYEMEMLAHSSIGVFLYLALGKGYEHLTGINCESEHDPLIALVGVEVPPYLKPSLIAHQGDRLARTPFRELCERDKPGANSNLCTAAAWIGKDLMIGAMSGSKNTNGQLHPATMHWKAEDGSRYYLRLLRRERGGHWNSHLRGIHFEARVEKEWLEVEVLFRTELDIEVFFEISGGWIPVEGITPRCWTLPGLTLQLEAEAPEPVVREYGGERIEVIYRYDPERSGARMWFRFRKI